MHREYGDPGRDSELSGHASQAATASRENWPGSHGVHSAEPPAALVPAGHFLHVDELVAFSAAEAYPGLQARHVLESPLTGGSSYVPAGHGTHPSEVGDEKKPAVHVTHDDEPVFAAVPRLQPMHTLAPSRE